MDFQTRGERLQLALSAGTNVRYYNDPGDLTALNNYGTVALNAQLGGRTSLYLNQTFSYTPTSLYGLFATVDAPVAGEVAAPSPDYSAASNRSLIFSTNAGLSYNFSTRNSLSFYSNLRRTNYVDDVEGFPDFQSYHFGGRFTYGFARDGALRFGYMYGRAEYRDVLRPEQHNIDIGIDHQWPLSSTRRTTLGFSGGSAVVSGPLPGPNPGGSPEAGSGEIANQFRVFGDATLTHQMGRTWRLRGAYRRGIGFVDGLTGPVATDALTLTTDGFLNRRTDLMMMAAYTDGEASLTVGGSDFTTYTAGMTARVALSRTWATYVEYVTYFYDFDDSAYLPPGVSPSLTRNNVRMGLTLWVPVRRR
jgi:hypothetical protein